LKTIFRCESASINSNSSNIIASLIIFFGFIYWVGDHICVVDKEEDLTGIIEEIALYQAWMLVKYVTMNAYTKQISLIFSRKAHTWL
jgi:hypothetical protein